MEIKTKSEFYNKYHLGLLGNKLRTFNNLDELNNSNYANDLPISIRYKLPNRPDLNAFGIPKYCVDHYVCGLIAKAEHLGKPAHYDLFTFNESAPDEEILIQGEVIWLDKCYLRYSFDKTNMRKAMEDSLFAEGIKAETIIRHFANENSWDMLRELNELYPDAVIEFGIYNHCLGVLPHHNMIIWEVRNY